MEGDCNFDENCAEVYIRESRIVFFQHSVHREGNTEATEEFLSGLCVSFSVNAVLKKNYPTFAYINLGTIFIKIAITLHRFETYTLKRFFSIASNICLPVF